jgi:hypothetical protein
MIKKKEIKKQIVQNKKYLQFLNFKDPLRFYFLTAYRSTNLFLTFYYRNLRLNQTFIIKKMSFGYRHRNRVKDKIFQRNKFKYFYGLMRPRILYMNRIILLFIRQYPEICNHPFFIKWHIYKTDYNFYLIFYKCSLYFYMAKFKIDYFRKKIGFKAKKDGTLQKVIYKIRNVFIRLYIKKSHNGCRPSKPRVLKKSRYKKATLLKNKMFHKDRPIKFFIPQTLDKLNEKIINSPGSSRK